MDDSWAEIDGMVSELGELYALEVEAAAFPELSGDPVIRDIHIAVLRVADEMQRVARAPLKSDLERARQALLAARRSAETARGLIVHAQAARNRDH